MQDTFKPINGYTKASILSTIQRLFTVKSVTETGACRYRGPEGSRCAVGVFIPDELYSRTMDTDNYTDVDNILKNYPELQSSMPLELDALKILQSIHDGRSKNIKQDLLNWVTKYVQDDAA